MTSPTSRRTLLFVDGYNAIGQSTVLRAMRDRDGLEAARWSLIQDLINYSAYRASHTQLVFDAHYRDDGGSREVLSEFLSVIYTEFSQSADTYIEKSCAAIARDLAQSRHRVVVATSDHAHRLTVSGYGAEWMSCAQLFGDLERATRSRRQDRTKAKQSSGRFLASGLDRSVRDKLAQMRFG